MQALLQDVRKNRAIYLMVLPVALYYIIFKYVPMYGSIIAFKDYSIAGGIWGSKWVGWMHFRDFFDSYYFVRVLKNTVLISLYQLFFGFPAPIALAILLNEIRKKWFKNLVQTISYLPHFVSLVVICGMIIDFTSREGIVNTIIEFFGGQRSSLLGNPDNFRTIYVSTQVWQELGWASIIYLAALSGINPDLYEAARVDGAGRFRQMWNITLPGLIPIIMILLILRIGGMMEVGFEKIILLYNSNTYETADVISSFVYRKGLAEANDYSFTTAVGLFQAVINFILLISANRLSNRFSGSKLW
ncbi:MAG: sugar transporter permease [Paenibacillaceae bacterium]|jgi:putative aldouronate transport system permease protein|nr:sugar transporter permease [Paenibacillaceae bacterium]